MSTNSSKMLTVLDNRLVDSKSTGSFGQRCNLSMVLTSPMEMPKGSASLTCDDRTCCLLVVPSSLFSSQVPKEEGEWHLLLLCTARTGRSSSRNSSCSSCYPFSRSSLRPTAMRRSRSKTCFTLLGSTMKCFSAARPVKVDQSQSASVLCSSHIAGKGTLPSNIRIATIQNELVFHFRAMIHR